MRARRPKDGERAVDKTSPAEPDKPTPAPPDHYWAPHDRSTALGPSTGTGTGSERPADSYWSRPRNPVTSIANAPPSATVAAEAAPVDLAEVASEPADLPSDPAPETAGDGAPVDKGR